jgi:phage-related protein
VTSKGSRSRIKWEGDSLKEIRSWPEDVRSNLGLELHRLENYEVPLDSKALGKGVSELRDQDKDSWYRILYALHSDWVYVLHCFKKKTRKIPKRDRQLAEERLQKAKGRGDAHPSEEDKRA